MMQLLIGLAFGLAIGIPYVLLQADFALPVWLPPRRLIFAWFVSQLFVHILFIVWIFARAGTHTRRLLAKHKTLGDFTNLKYTFTRFIGFSDFVVLFALNILAMIAVLVW